MMYTSTKGSSFNVSKAVFDRLGKYKLTFGKYKGLTLREVPKDYLRWCKDNITSKALQRELKKVYLG